MWLFNLLAVFVSNVALRALGFALLALLCAAAHLLVRPFATPAAGRLQTLCVVCWAALAALALPAATQTALAVPASNGVRALPAVASWSAALLAAPPCVLVLLWVTRWWRRRQEKRRRRRQQQLQREDEEAERHAQRLCDRSDAAGAPGSAYVELSDA